MPENPYKSPEVEDASAIERDIVERVTIDFPPEVVSEVLEKLAVASNCPRIQRCIVFAARGHSWFFDMLCRLAKDDYRDVILAAEYSRFSDRLYDFNKPFDQAKLDDPHSNRPATH